MVPLRQRSSSRKARAVSARCRSAIGESVPGLGVRFLGERQHFRRFDPEHGRDMLARLLYGGRTSLLMGIVPVLVASLIGGTLGVLAGFIGGRVNTAIMRTMDVFYAFPSVLLAIAICGVLGAGLGNTLLSLTVIFIPPLVRITESLDYSLRGDLVASIDTIAKAS